ncbi:DNA mismatch repair protein [Grosmannia clavigera kw1407]|uniref:DNA mismatch repair protein n=1 Tax=Grosmannia clavigera (strain kw1407 / UAMH 11150) TaxID=655863 RepID=F0XQS2_GROCL|nr:DNA mismatch repair protein [Grosmannia clavigera kw1407]EFW99775.1 DNA mismatch repair protein [Grosmannia clavigera kw1407]
MKTETQAGLSGAANIPTTKMLYRVYDGPEREESYGISLARAIGFPGAFIAKAESVAGELRQQARANRTDEHELQEARRQKLVTELVRQLRLGHRSQADDEELWRYLQQVNDKFWSNMFASENVEELEGSGDDEIDYGHSAEDELEYFEQRHSEMTY